MNSGEITFTTVKRSRIVEDVAEQLRRKITLGELPVGAKIPTEPELMSMFGVGRSTVREAVQVLAHAGLLEKRQGNGTFVTGSPLVQEPLDLRLRRAGVLEVYEVRFMLEVEMARLAAERRDERDLEQMRNCLEERNNHLAEGRMKPYLDADIAFHQAVAAATKNAVTAELYRTFTEVLRQALDHYSADPGTESHYTEQHIRLYEAIRDRNPEEAVAWTLQHLQGVKKGLEGLLR